VTEGRDDKKKGHEIRRGKKRKLKKGEKMYRIRIKLFKRQNPKLCERNN